MQAVAYHHRGHTPSTIGPSTSISRVDSLIKRSPFQLTPARGPNPMAVRVLRPHATRSSPVPTEACACKRFSSHRSCLAV